MTINELDVHILIISETPAALHHDTFNASLDFILQCHSIHVLRSTLGHSETSVVTDVTLHSSSTVSFEPKRSKVSQLLLYGRIFDTVLYYTYSLLS